MVEDDKYLLKGFRTINIVNRIIPSFASLYVTQIFSSSTHNRQSQYGLLIMERAQTHPHTQVYSAHVKIEI